MNCMRSGMFGPPAFPPPGKGTLALLARVNVVPGLVPVKSTMTSARSPGASSNCWKMSSGLKAVVLLSVGPHT